MKTHYSSLFQTPSFSKNGASVFTCGLRSVAEIDLSRDRFGRSATSPVDILTEVNIVIEGMTPSSVHLFPNHVEKTHHYGEELTARSIWFAPWEEPFAIAWWRFTNHGPVTHLKLNGEGIFNLNYVSKFRQYPNDTARIQEEQDANQTIAQIEVRDAIYPHLCGVLATTPVWDECHLFELTSVEPTDTMTVQGIVGFRFHKHLIIPSNAEIDFVLCYGGSDDTAIMRAALRKGVNDYAALFETFLETWNRHLNAGVIIQTPDQNVNEMLLVNKLWAFKDTRVVPFGKPFSTDSFGEPLPILTASPDYHGVFANDNVQSAWEWGALGESFYQVLRNSIEVLYHFGVPESVEIDPINATGKPWIQALELGPKPQWVMGACSLILWSGDKSHDLWNSIIDVLSQFFEDDSDGDYLDDFTRSTYPEQPDPGDYHHEMLYVNTFWAQAFHMGAQVATLFNNVELTNQYKQTAERITQAINEKFATEYGYASWLNADHKQHPHPGHNMILPLQYQLAEPVQAEKTFQTIFTPPQWTDEGMLVSGPDYPMRGDAYVWDFMRWNLIHALFLYDKKEEGLKYLTDWALHEKSHHFQAPEGFPTITGATGKGYSWTSGRMIRALLFGLCGLELLPEGFTFKPHLPSAWNQVALNNLPFRGATYNVTIKRGESPGIFLDGIVCKDGVINGTGSIGYTVLVIVV